MTEDTTMNLAEWIETDGLGGFASGTVRGRRTRRYHALLLVAQNSPADRVVLVGCGASHQTGWTALVANCLQAEGQTSGRF